MAIRDKIIFIDSDNLIKIVGVNDGSEEAITYINDATVLFSLFRGTAIICDEAAVVDDGGGLVTLPITDNGIVSGDHIRVTGTNNYNGEYDCEVGTDNAGIQITAVYVIEDLTDKSLIYHGFDDAKELVMAYITGSDGNYQIDMPSTVDLRETVVYTGFIDIEDTGGNKKLIKIPLQAEYATS
jgi:hypothetical protein